jgi:hypothetical protein
MCGDDDDINHIDEDLFSQFLKTAKSLGVSADKQMANTPVDLTDEKARSDYMDGLFKAALSRVVNDSNFLHEGEKMDILAGQAIVFARLSGLLAGQFPNGSDLFHTVVSALMQGHKEATSYK